MVIATQIRPCSSSSISSGLNAGDNSAEEQSIGATVRQTLQCANRESRAIVGLSESIHALSKTPEEFLFCFLATGTDHMHEVLLEAFCFEHDIYIIKLDNADKLSRTLGSPQLASCALVQKRGPETVTVAEDELVDYCEAHWEEPIKPIVKLPEK